MIHWTKLPENVYTQRWGDTKRRYNTCLWENLQTGHGRYNNYNYIGKQMNQNMNLNHEYYKVEFEKENEFSKEIKK